MKRDHKSALGDRLKQSAANRLAMLKLFGTIPHSILRLSRGELSRAMLRLQGERPDRNPAYGDEAVEKRKRLADVGYTKGGASGVHCGRGDHLGLSTMPPELVDFFVKYYAAPGQTYLDPFAGQGIRMQVAKLRGLHYIGYDLCKEFVDFALQVKKRIDDGRTRLDVYYADSKHPAMVDDNSGDFSFYSPPYWDIEYYGEHPEQLGTGKTYTQFLDGTQEVAKNWLPKFKDSATMVVNVNDFRKDGHFYAYHSDVIQCFTLAGWTLTDTWIIDGLVGGLPKAFAVDFNLQKVAPKVHEYALVFRKTEKSTPAP